MSAFERPLLDPERTLVGLPAMLSSGWTRYPAIIRLGPSGGDPMLKQVAEILVLCCVVLCGAKATAQSAVPIEQEPAHRLVLQNGHIRVFEIRLPSGEDTLWHVHRHDGISVRLADATIEDQPQDGRAKTLQLRRGGGRV
jgi:hypothetical protein